MCDHKLLKVEIIDGVELQTCQCGVVVRQKTFSQKLPTNYTRALNFKKGYRGEMPTGVYKIHLPKLRA